jgi:hypothetical protein
MAAKRKRQRRVCPRCRQPLIAHDELKVCAVCLLIWRGDTFEPLTREALGLSSLYDYFFRA